MIPKALWIARNQPDLWARAAKVGEYQDFVTLRLTGRWTGSLNNATMRWHYRTEAGGWPDALLAALDLSELRDKWPAELAAPGEVIGPLTADAAAHLGLPETVAVVQGGADAFIGMVGLGVRAPGDLALITGSSHLQLGIASAATHAPGVWGTYADCVYPGRPVIEGGQTSTGSVIAWFKRHFAPDATYDDLNAAAAALPPGAEGLLAVDHFQGNRTPHTDALARGAITGLTLKHTPAHVYRALIEGVCLGTRAIVDAFGDAFEAKRIVVAGGAVNAPFWLQIHADTLGLPLEITEQPQAPALGSAILAGVGAGWFETIDDGLRGDGAHRARGGAGHGRACRLRAGLRAVRGGVRGVEGGAGGLAAPDPQRPGPERGGAAPAGPAPDRQGWVRGQVGAGASATACPKWTGHTGVDG